MAPKFLSALLISRSLRVILLMSLAKAFVVMKIYTVTDEVRESQLRFTLYYYVTLMCNVFRLEHKELSSGEIRATNKFIK